MVTRMTMLVLALLLSLSSSLWAAQVSAVIDRDQIASGDSLVLELRIKGSLDDDPDLSILERNWEILNQSKSSQMQLINGSFSRSQVLALSLMPRSSGNLEIPSVCFGSVCSLPLKVTVSDKPLAGDMAPEVLLEAEVDSRQVPVGAQLLLTVQLRHRVDLLQASLSEPRVEGVETELRQLGGDRSFEIRRDGFLYQVIERRYTLFPQQAGQLNISALQLDAQIDSGAARRDLFNRSVQQLRRSSNALQVQVTPPTDLRSRQWLPARHLTLHDDWQQQPPTLRVGEPATRTLTLVAEGLPAASLPELQLPTPEGWKSYPDQPSRQDTENDQGIVGTLQQKLALVPTRPGTVELPALDLDWFDVSANRWSHSHLDPLKLKVAPAAPGSVSSSPFSQVSEASPAPVLAPPSAPIAEEPTATVAPEIVSPGLWPWLSLVLGLGWFSTLLLRWRYRRNGLTAKQEPDAEDKRRESEKQAFKAVLKAAECSDPQATRQALLRWIVLSRPVAAGQELATLRCLGDRFLNEALNELDKNLYGLTAEPWRGETLCAALKKLPKEQQPAAEALPPLYPPDS